MAATGPFDRTPESVDTMSGSDALLWTIGADPILRPTVVALVVLESTPEWSAVRDRIHGMTEAVPRLRARAVDRFPVVTRPQFVPDPAFDLADHVRRLRLPEHGGLRDVLDLAQSMAGSGSDPALPLWEAVVVEGMGDGRAALLVKVHHAVIDGVGGLAVLAGLLDGGSRRRRRRGRPRRRRPQKRRTRRRHRTMPAICPVPSSLSTRVGTHSFTPSARSANCARRVRRWPG